MPPALSKTSPAWQYAVQPEPYQLPTNSAGHVVYRCSICVDKSITSPREYPQSDGLTNFLWHLKEFHRIEMPTEAQATDTARSAAVMEGVTPTGPPTGPYENGITLERIRAGLRSMLAEKHLGLSPDFYQSPHFRALIQAINPDGNMLLDYIDPESLVEAEVQGEQ